MANTTLDLSNEQINELTERVTEKLAAQPFGRPHVAIALVAIGQVAGGIGGSISDIHDAMTALKLPLHRLNYVPHVDEDDVPKIKEWIAANRRSRRR